MISPINDKKAYFLISGQYFQSETLFPSPDKNAFGEWNLTAGTDVLRFTLQVGNKYWMGKSWGSTETVFRVKVGKDRSTKVWYNWSDITNNVDFTMNVDNEGWAIPVTAEDGLSGKIKLTMYRPFPYQYGGGLIRNIPNFLFMKDLKLELHAGVENTEVNSSDIRYENTINEEFVNEFNDIKLKINTQTDKAFSLSSVLQNNSNSYKYNEGVYDMVLEKEQIQEYNLIERLHGHYSKPKVIFQSTLENVFTPYTVVHESTLPIKVVVDYQEIDYRQNTSTITLNEI